MNWEHVLSRLVNDTPDVSLPHVSPHEPILISRLPPDSVLQAQAKQEAKRAYSQALLDESLSTSLDGDAITEAAKRPVSSPPLASQVFDAKRNSMPSARPQRKIAFWELLRAIEKKDLQTIFEVRQSNFEMLTRKEGGSTPLLHCLRLGQGHSDVAVILCGAFSRWVNNLDEQPPDKATKALAIAVRANLRLAINASLKLNQMELISSYLSVIVASSGDKWLRETSSDVALALKGGPASRPVATAGQAIRTFATSELRSLSVPGHVAIASVEDFLANATADLLMMAAWSSVPDATEELPLYMFARDDRLYRAFRERIEGVEASAAYKKLSRQQRGQISTLIAVLEPKAIGHREKAARLAKELDAP